MSLVTIVGAVGVVVTLAALGLSVRSAGEPLRIRPGLESLRIVVGVAGLAAMGLITAVFAQPVPLLIAVTAGGGIGYEILGKELVVTRRHGTRYAARSVFGIAVYMVSLGVMQIAGLGNRVGAFRVGQVAAVFGLALLIGTIAGRELRAAGARTSGRRVGPAAMLLLVMVGAAVTPFLFRSEAGARGIDVEPDDLCSVLPVVPGFEPEPDSFPSCAIGDDDAFGPGEDGTYALVVVRSSASEAREAVTSEIGEIDGEFITSADIGDFSAFRGGFGDEDGTFNFFIAWHRGPLFGYVLEYGERDPTAALGIARAMDERMATLGLGAGSADSSDTDSDVGADPTAADDPGDPDVDATDIDSSELDGDEIDADGADGDDADADGADADELADDEDISDDEAIQQAVAGVLAALAMGLISASEASEMLSRLRAEGDAEATNEDEDDEENEERIVELELTYPVGRSPRVFQQGWLFGARCIVDRGTPSQEDRSENVRWSGTGTFDPATGSSCRPRFGRPGLNTITLSIEVDGVPHTSTTTVDVVATTDYARVGHESKCPACAHGCPACPHTAHGPFISGSPTVLIDELPAVRIGDPGIHATCCGSNTYTAAEGDPTVLIDGRPAVRIGDRTVHCGGDGTVIQGSHGNTVG